MQPLVDVINLADAATFDEAFSSRSTKDLVWVAPGVDLPERWLERLSECAQREPLLATASVLSGPEPALDPFFEAANAGLAIELPFALPACAYVTRRALDAVGPPRSVEVAALLEFCARASAAGFRHVLRADVYAVDAAPAAQARDLAWREAIDADPARAAEWRDFTLRDPMRPLRRRADVARLGASRRPRLLFVTHRWGGGIQRHVGDLARLLSDRCEVLALRPGSAGSTCVQWLRPGEALEAWFETPSEWARCVELLRAIGISRVHFHHVHGLPLEVLDLPRALGVAHDVTLHDYYPICPQYHLADAQGRYCGEPAEEGCRACLAKRPAQWPLAIGEWRARFGDLLARADRVIAPSADVATRVQRYFPAVRARVWPHPEVASELPIVHKVLVLGGISSIKGIDLFERCVQDAMSRSLPLHFHVLGHISRPLALGEHAPVTISGSYDESRLARLVALERPDAFLFLSQVPESYSYTLSTAMRFGRPIVATRIGAFVERLGEYSPAALVDPAAAANAVNDALMRLLRPGANAVARPSAVSVR